MRVKEISFRLFYFCLTFVFTSTANGTELSGLKTQHVKLQFSQAKQGSLRESEKTDQ